MLSPDITKALTVTVINIRNLGLQIKTNCNEFGCNGTQ